MSAQRRYWPQIVARWRQDQRSQVGASARRRPIAARDRRHRFHSRQSRRQQQVSFKFSIRQTIAAFAAPRPAERRFLPGDLRNKQPQSAAPVASASRQSRPSTLNTNRSKQSSTTTSSSSNRTPKAPPKIASSRSTDHSSRPMPTIPQPPISSRATGERSFSFGIG